MQSEPLQEREKVIELLLEKGAEPGISPVFEQERFSGQAPAGGHRTADGELLSHDAGIFEEGAVADAVVGGPEGGAEDQRANCE